MIRYRRIRTNLDKSNTILIPKLGPIEGVLNTPSAHRVHHGRNGEYVDRNLGEFVIIYDRIFGTYVEEKDDTPVEFGLVKQVPQANPIVVAFHDWIRLMQDLRIYPWKYWPALVFGPPGWKPDETKMTSNMLRQKAALARQRAKAPDR